MNRQDVYEPYNNAPPEIRKLLKRVIDAEKAKQHMKNPKGINDDILTIIREEIQ